jgi:FkbM family methyltransferase
MNAGPSPLARIDRPALTAAIVRLLARRTPYVEPEMLGLGELVGPGNVCLDVGAAAGLYTLALSQLVGPTGQVISVEPLASGHPMWTRVLRARDNSNVAHHGIALGVEPGQCRMSVPIGRYGPVTGRSFLEFRTNGLGSNAEFRDQIEVMVDVDTMDHLCADLDRLDFVKIDVEGAELHVLEGGRDTVARLRPTLLVEIEARHTSRYGHSPRDLVEWLTGRGYSMQVWHDNEWRDSAAVCAHTRNYLFRPTR